MTDEYIRREDVVKECGEWYVEEGTEEGFIGTVSQMLDMFSPADVVQVVHSRWSDKMERVDTYHPFAGIETDYYHRCLNCGRRGKGFSWNFCPYCGAKMDAHGEE